VPDLSTKYLGFHLKNPLVVSASPLTEDLDNIKRMEDEGAAAIVMHSLFEEQITLQSQELDCHLSHGVESYPEALTYFPDMSSYNLGPEEYLNHLNRAKKSVNIPIFGSLNGVSTGTWTSWVDFARKIQDAGADGLELNLYFLPTDPTLTGEQIEEMYCDLVRAVKRNLRIPLAVKIGPHFSSMSNMACRLEQAGADALVLFNRFYQPDFDLEKLEVTPRLTLSSPYEALLRLHWVAILFPRIKADLAITGGLHDGEGVLKAMMAGARVAMMTSALLKHGLGHISVVLDQIQTWMVDHEYKSIHQMHGSLSHWAVAEPAAFERANYLRVLSSYTMSKRPGAA
jgi:dihydroorotate dehydrogenase (fumarate)